MKPKALTDPFWEPGESSPLRSEGGRRKPESPVGTFRNRWSASFGFNGRFDRNMHLERRRPIDLLPHASSQAIATWLRRHPNIRIVSRDRSGMFADGAQIGAPQAVQVADRWHLLKNLGDGVERYLTTISVPRISVPRPVVIECIWHNGSAENGSENVIGDG